MAEAQVKSHASVGGWLRPRACTKPRENRYNSVTDGLN